MMKGDRLFTVCVSILTVLLSSTFSFFISNRSIKRSAISESQRESLLKDSPVLNKIFDISGECDIVLITFIEQINIREGLVTRYMNPDSTIIKRDTTYTFRVEYDTSYCRIPKFIYEEGSFDLVREDLEYISNHVDELSFKTHKQIIDLLQFVQKHPLVKVNSTEEARDSEWARMGIYMTFYKKVNDITQSYYLRLNEYGLKE